MSTLKQEADDDTVSLSSQRTRVALLFGSSAVRVDR